MKGFCRWRDADYEFVKLGDTVDKRRQGDLRRDLLRLYPDQGRSVFNHLEKTLGQNFKYVEASLFIQKEIKEKYGLT